MEFIDFIKLISKMEIEDHGFNVSLRIYDVRDINHDDNIVMSFLTEDDAKSYASTNSDEKFHLYVHKHLVWFNE